MMFSIRSKAVRMVKTIMLMGVGLSLALSSGCATSKLGKQTVKINHYPTCYQPIDQIRQDADAKARNTAGGAILGAIGGALIGYAQGGERGAVVGGVAGAIVGGVAANLITEEVQSRNRTERFAAYSQSLNEDIRGLQAAVAAARLTSKCYQNAYKTLDRMYKAGQVGRDEMVAKLTEIRDGTNDANEILTNYAASIAGNQMVYKDIQKAEVQKGANGLSKSQLSAMAGKQRQLNTISRESQQELDALMKLNQLCGSQLKTITARNTPSSTPVMYGSTLTICPAAGD